MYYCQLGYAHADFYGAFGLGSCLRWYVQHRQQVVPQQPDQICPAHRRHVAPRPEVRSHHLLDFGHVAFAHAAEGLQEVKHLAVARKAIDYPLAVALSLYQ